MQAPCTDGLGLKGQSCSGPMAHVRDILESVTPGFVPCGMGNILRKMNEQMCYSHICQKEGGKTLVDSPEKEELKVPCVLPRDPLVLESQREGGMEEGWKEGRPEGGHRKRKRTLCLSRQFVGVVDTFPSNSAVISGLKC